MSKAETTVNEIDVTTTLPIYARSEANNRDNRRKKAARVKEQRGVVRAMIHGHACRVLQMARVFNPNPVFDVSLTRIRRRSAKPLDDDNLRTSLKAVRDGVADALGIDDGDTKRLRFTYAQEPGSDFGVRIQIKSTGGTVNL